jgi:hypothetical protein
MRIGLKRLDQSGFDHMVMLLVFFVLFALAGSYWLVSGHAATSNTGQIVGIAGKCLDNRGNTKVPYNKIELFTCNTTGAQQWTLTSSGTIVNNNGYCLDVYHSGVWPSTVVDLYPCNGTVAQKWVVDVTKHTIVNPNSKLCLDDRWSGTKDGNQIQIYTCNGTAAQHWTTPKASTTGGGTPTPPPITPPKPTPTPTPAPAPKPTPTPTGFSCTTAAVKGQCPSSGFYADSHIVGGTNPWINQNIWGASGTNYQQKLYANSPEDWYITASVSNNTQGGVLAFPNTGWSMPYPEKALDSYSSITSSWNVTIPTNSQTTDGWAAYDLWFNNWADEVMIQTDITANSNYNCAQKDIKFSNVTIDGQSWHMCQFGSERVVKPGANESSIRNVPSGSLNIQDILKYLETNKYIPAKSTWTAGSFGFEVCNTSGTTQTFKVNGFSWSAK